MGELVKKTEGEVAVQSERLGFDEPVDQRDLIIPVAKLFQGTVTEQQEFPNAKAGQVVNSLTQDVLDGSFVPVYKWTEYARFNGRKATDAGFDPAFAPGAVIWKTRTPSPEQMAECEFGANNEKPLGIRSMCFLAYFVGQSMPVIIRFSKTSFSAGKKLLSLAQFSGGNMFDRRYKLTTKREEKDGSVYFIFVVSPDGISTDDERKIAREWYTSLRSQPIVAHDDTQPLPGDTVAKADFEE